MDEVTNDLGQFTVVNGQRFNTSTHNSIEIYGGSGGLTTNILANVRPLSLFGAHDYDAVNIGDATHPLQRIQRLLDIENPLYYNVVTIDDRADGAFRSGAIDVVNLHQQAPYELVTGLGAAAMEIKVADTRSVTLRTGPGGSLINVLATAAFPFGGGTTVEGHTPNSQPPNDTVNVGGFNTPQTLGYILGPLAITNPPNWTHVYINDGLDNATHNGQGQNPPIMALTATSLTGLSPGAIRFGPNDLASLAITVGNGNNTYNIVNTQNAGVPGGNLTTLSTGWGTDAVNVQGASGPLTVNGGGAATITLGDASNTLAGITNAVTVNGTPTDALVLNDQGWPGPRNYTITATTVWWGGPPVTYNGPGSLTLNTSAGNDIINIQSTAAGTATAVNTGDGDNTVNLSQVPQDLNTLAGSLAVQLGLSTNNVLNLFDNLAPPTPGDYTVSDTAATAATAPALNLTYAFAANAGAVDIWANPGSLPVTNLTSAITCLFNGIPC
jgi:hypothetical protein